MQAHSQGAVATRYLKNIKDKHAAQPAKKRVTLCSICMCDTLSHLHVVSVQLSWLETTEKTQFYFDLSDQASET
jgi:hypothetical protein